MAKLPVRKAVGLLYGARSVPQVEFVQASIGSTCGTSRSVSAALFRKFVKQPSTTLAAISTISSSANQRFLRAVADR